MLYNNFTQQQYQSHHVIIPSTQTQGALILGDLNAATNLQLIHNYNIKTIITAASGLEHLKIPSQLTHIVFPLVDKKQENIQTYFELSNQTIQENLKRGAVLVHCGAGISRSASLIIAYFMKKHQTSFKNAISHVRKIKPNVCPNLGFELQLKNYQNKLSSETQNKGNKTTSTQQKSAKKHQSFALSTSSPFVFELPINTVTSQSTRNHPKTMNRSSFNRTHGSTKPMHKQPQIKQQLFIQGRNKLDTLEKYDQGIDMTQYEPGKYNHKLRRQGGWGSINKNRKY